MKQEVGEFPYKNKDCYVFTRSSYKDTDNVTFVNDDINNFINKLRNKAGRNIWVVGGGELLHSFIQEDLVDEFIITIAPTIIGNGIPLFKEGNQALDLSLKGTQRFNQFIELHYEVRK